MNHPGTQGYRSDFAMNELINAKRLTEICRKTRGSADLKAGIIDGPEMVTHPDFEGVQIEFPCSERDVSCRLQQSLACRHGTMVLGILASKHGSPAPALCPGCKFIVRTIFTETGPEGSFSGDGGLKVILGEFELGLLQAAHSTTFSMPIPKDGAFYGRADIRLTRGRSP